MIGYVAKDYNGEVFLHSELPTYDSTFRAWFSSPDTLEITRQFPEFDNMFYKDEPVKVEIKLERI